MVKCSFTVGIYILFIRCKNKKETRIIRLLYLRRYLGYLRTDDKRMINAIRVLEHLNIFKDGIGNKCCLFINSVNFGI